MELGELISDLRDSSQHNISLALKPIIRKASEDDIRQHQINIDETPELMRKCRKCIEQAQLDMNLISAEYTLDRTKVIFSYVADERVDFRELLKLLAATFKCRIELRQIGVRDEAKLLGGIGPCGRKLCCATFLGDFIPVSIKMAKDQGMSLNPTKISGLCGRLMCCLKYENEEYEQAKKEMPDRGKEVETPDGKGCVVGLDLLSRVVKVRLHDRQTAVEYGYEELVTK